MAERNRTAQGSGVGNQDEELNLEELEQAAGGTFSEPVINNSGCVQNDHCSSST